MLNHIKTFLLIPFFYLHALAYTQAQATISITNFDIRKTKLADDIYIVEGNDIIPTQRAWGYCDGKKIYIRVARNLFELDKQDRSFSFMGSEILTHRYYKPNDSRRTYNDDSSPAASISSAALDGLLNPTYNGGNEAATSIRRSVVDGLLTTDRFKIRLIPMPVDMETGEVY